MTQQPTFGRITTAMVTPFSSSGDVDYDEAVRLAEHLLNTGTSTILLTGTTGESPTLTHDEEYHLYRRFVSEFKGRAPMMVGTGSNSTRTAVDSTKMAEDIGADAILQVVPYYNKPSQQGMIQHFKSIASETSLPILLYNIPGRTGVNMLPETMAELANVSNIVGVKEASGSVEQVRAIRSMCPNDFEIYSGDDGLTLDFMAEGACGVVSVAAHVAGMHMTEMIDHFVAGQPELAKEKEQCLKPLFDVLFITSNPSPVKYALRKLGFSVGDPRLPLLPVTDVEAEKIDHVLSELSLVTT